MIDIDGSFGEGGGQVLRTALTLSALTGRATHIHHIRANRRNPGLAPQHLTGVQALADICQAKLQGAALRSQDLVFQPTSAPKPGQYTFDVAKAAAGGSAGSVALIFQTILCPLLFCQQTSKVTLKGGTHVAWSPPFHYIADVYLPMLAPSGVAATCDLIEWGFYPRGGGVLTAKIGGNDAGVVLPLQPVSYLNRGALRRVQGLAVACNLPAHIAQRMANRAENVLRGNGLTVDIKPTRISGPGPGAGLFLTAEYEQALAGFSALGRRGLPSEAVADNACQDLLTHYASDAPIDLHLADQLLLPLALAKGRSEFFAAQISQHLLTNAQIIRQFVDAQITVNGKEREAGTVTVDGVGFVL